MLDTTIIRDITETVNTSYEAVHHKTMTPEKAIGGVLNSSNPEWLHEDLNDAIDLGFEEYIKENPGDEFGDEYYNDETTYLIGFILNSEGLYEPDDKAEYSAIVNCPYTQIVKSKYVSKCSMCSMCYHGQGDLDTAGDQVAYTLPPDVFGDAEHLPITSLEE